MSFGYDLKLVYDYIWGNDIEGYSIDELENNPDFMLLVLEKSKDKRMYDLCSDLVKSSYLFVRGVIDLFKDDLDFLSVVVNNYFDTLTDAEKEQGTRYAELNILMSNLYGKVVNEFTIGAAGFYEFERQRAKACINAFEDLTMKEESKEGFIITAVEYEDNPIIVDFVSRRMINSALYNGRFDNLEYLVHRRFKSISDFENYGELRFLQDCINSYDCSLATYVFDQSKAEMFDAFFGQALKEASGIKYRWPIYMDRVNSWRINVFQYDMNRYMLENDYFGNLSYQDVASYVAHKLGVKEVFKKYDQEFLDNYDDRKYRILDTNDVRCLNNGLELANKLFSVDVINDNYDDYDVGCSKKNPPNNNRGKNIIKFKLSEG